MWTALTAAVAVLAVAGCTRAERGGAADAPGVETALTVARTTTQSTEPPMTIAVATAPTNPSGTAVTSMVTLVVGSSSTSSTTAPVPTTSDDGDLLLRADGIGQLGFGTSEDHALATLEAALGDVASESSNTYAVDRGDGTYLDDSSAEVFVHPAQHTVCFDNGLCVIFGGDAEDSRVLVGWVQDNQGVSPPLATIDGVTAGSNWAVHVDDLDVADSGCYSIGYGMTSGGIHVELFSAGDPFLAYDDAGNQVPTEPNPADVTVTQLSAGPRPGNPEEEDC